MSSVAGWSPWMYLRRAGRKAPPSEGEEGSEGNAGTSSDSDTLSRTGIGTVSTKSACQGGREGGGEGERNVVTACSRNGAILGSPVWQMCMSLDRTGSGLQIQTW